MQTRSALDCRNWWSATVMTDPQGISLASTVPCALRQSTGLRNGIGALAAQLDQDGPSIF